MILMVGSQTILHRLLLGLILAVSAAWLAPLASYAGTKEKIEIPAGMTDLMRVLNDYELSTGKRFHIPSFVSDLKLAMDRLSEPGQHPSTNYQIKPYFDHLINGLDYGSMNHEAKIQKQGMILRAYVKNTLDPDPSFSHHDFAVFKVSQKWIQQNPSLKSSEFLLAELEQIQIPNTQEPITFRAVTQSPTTQENLFQGWQSRTIKDQVLENEDFFDSISGKRFFIHRSDQSARLIEEQIALDTDGAFTYTYFFPAFVFGSIPAQPEFRLLPMKSRERWKQVHSLNEDMIQIKTNTRNLESEPFVLNLDNLSHDTHYFEKILRQMKENPQQYTDDGRFLASFLKKQKPTKALTSSHKQSTKLKCPFSVNEERSSNWAIDGETVYVQMGYLDDPEHDMVESIDNAMTYELERRLLNSECGIKKEYIQWVNAANEEMEIPVFKWRKKFSDHLYFLQIIVVPPATEKEIEQAPSRALKHRLQSFVPDTSSFVYFGHARHGKGMDILPYDKFKAKYAENIFAGSLAEILKQNQVH